MNELRIICMRPVTFSARILMAICLAMAPALEVMRDKAIGDVSGMTWLIIIVAAAGQAANAASAWFSTTSGTAKAELKNGNSNNQQKPV